MSLFGAGIIIMKQSFWTHEALITLSFISDLSDT